MTVSMLNDCLLIFQKGEDQYSHEIASYFKTINVPVFNPLLRDYDSTCGALVVVFILCAFSEDSPMVVSRQDSVQEKEQICDFLGITDSDKRERLIYLRDEVIKECVVNYLVQFCGEEYRSYMFMRIQLQDYDYDIVRRQFTIHSTVTTDDEEKPTQAIVHYDQKEHGKAVIERDKLAKRIEQTEKSMAQKTKRIGISNMDDWIRRGGSSGIRKQRSGNPERLVLKKTGKGSQ